jgi:hypothetical protein
MIKNDYGIKGKPITVGNPKANAIVGRASSPGYWKYH